MKVFVVTSLTSVGILIVTIFMAFYGAWKCIPHDGRYAKVWWILVFVALFIFFSGFLSVIMAAESSIVSFDDEIIFYEEVKR